jgi:hypothetical protein
VLKYRIENRGTVSIAYGMKLIIQEKVSEEIWRPAPFTPTGPWPQVLAHLAAGHVGRWQMVEIPADAEPGTYRIKKEVRLETGHRFLVAPFMVTTP